MNVPTSVRRPAAGVALAVAMVLAVAACGSDDDSGGSEGSSSSAKTVDIGAPLTLSGPAAPFGEGEQNGMELAAKEQEQKGGVDFNFDFKDDAGDQAQAVTIAQGFVRDQNVDVVVGMTASGAAAASLAVLGKGSMPTLFLLPETPDASTGPEVYRITSPEFKYLNKLVDTMKANGITKLATIYDNSNPTFIATHEAMQPLLDDAGIELVATEVSTAETTNFRPQLTKVADSGAQALEIGVTGSSNVAVIKQAREAGLDIPMYAHDGLGVPSLVDQLGSNSGEVYFASQFSWLSDDPTAKEFVDRYEKEYGGPPDPYAAAAYDGINLLAQIARDGDGEVTRDTIAQGLSDLGSFEGVRGTFEFSPERDAVGTELGVITKVMDGKPELLAQP